MNSVELLSPAGDAKSFKAAILAGANAIFFGVENFNARQRAENISFENLSDLIKLAKSKNVKSYLTLNTLVYDSEFSLLIETVQNAIECGIDAVIIQDMGVLFLIKKFFPDLEIHASTQMTTHNILQCEFLSEVGVSQINLSRELSLSELKPLVKVLNEKNIVAEIFVHGAYCISFSGQCYFSNYLYGEAGNRGLCVQPCRREFYSSNKNFISPFNLKDNCAINFVNELKQLGNISLKIEGRIKNFDYVWAITNEWKNNLENNFLNPSEKKLNEKNNLIYKVMNRSYSDDYLKGEVTSSMFTFGSKDHSFVETGIVTSYTAKNCRIKFSENSIEENDKIIIKDKNENFICSGILLDYDRQKKDFKLHTTSKSFSKIFSGYKVYIQKDIINKFDLEKQIESLSIPKKNIFVKVFASENKKLYCEFILEEQNLKVKVESNSVLQVAQKNSLTKEIIFEKFNRLGQTDFIIEKNDYEIFEKNLFLPLKELNEIRREAIEFFENKINQKTEKDVCKDKNNFNIETFNKSIFSNSKKISKQQNEQKEILFFSDIEKLNLCYEKNKNQNFYMLEFPCVCDTEEFKIKSEFVIKNNFVIPYFPAIIFDKEINGFKNLIDNLNSDRIIFSENTGLIFYANQKGLQIFSGQHLNITNSYSVEFYKKYLTSCVLSFETPFEQLKSILKNHSDEKFIFNKSSLQLLMQSRQCLVKKLSGCKKEICDLDCLKNCSKQIKFKDKTGKELIAVKRKGFYSAIYADKIIQSKEKENFIKENFSYIIIDKRNILEY